MRLVLIESPYRAETEWELARNLAYMRALLLDSVRRGEAPTALHGLLTQVMDDRSPVERAAGIACHIAWASVADAIVVGVDGGISDGMQAGIEAHRSSGRIVDVRTLPGWLEAWTDREALVQLCDREGRNYFVPQWLPHSKAR